MRIEGKQYRTIWFENNVVKIIDQTKLPHQFILKDLKSVRDVINAIKTMEVRGAPLIGATAAFGLVLAIIENNDQSFLKESANELISTRPTAINLKWAVDRIMKKLSGVNSDKIFKIALNEANEICEDHPSKVWDYIGLSNSRTANPYQRGIYGRLADHIRKIQHIPERRLFSVRMFQRDNPDFRIRSPNKIIKMLKETSGKKNKNAFKLSSSFGF